MPLAHVIYRTVRLQTSTMQLPARTLVGLAFSIPELTLFENLAKASSLRIEIRLDHGSDTEEFEEVLAFHVGDRSPCRWLVWRDAIAIFVQPLIGRAQRYESVAEVFEALAAKQPAVSPDIKATRWPASSLGVI
jgi:hypothetical protein